jgi:hypothetical protein
MSTLKHPPTILMRVANLALEAFIQLVKGFMTLIPQLFNQLYEIFLCLFVFVLLQAELLLCPSVPVLLQEKFLLRP